MVVWQPDCWCRVLPREPCLHWGVASDRPVLANGHSPLVGSVPPRVRFTVRVKLTKVVVLVQPPKEQPLAAYWVVVSEQPFLRLRVG